MAKPDAASWPAAARALAGLSPRMRLAAAFAAGAVMALAQPPLGLWPAFFIAGPAALWLWRLSLAAPRPGRATFLCGWAFGTGHFTLALHWIVEPFLVDAARHGWMAPFAAVMLCGGLALFWGAAFWAAGAIARRFETRGAWGDALLLAAALALGEIARSSVLTGFPWALAVYAWMETPVAQAGALIGPYAITLLTLAAMMLAGAAGQGRLRLAPPVAALAIVAAGWAWGAARLASPEAAAAPDGPLVRAVQTAVDQNEKWAPENVAPNLRMLIELSRRPTGDPDAPRPAVTVWPESAVTFLLARSPNALAEIAAAIGGGEPGGGETVTGALRHAEGPDAEVTDASRWRNSLYLIRRDATLSEPYDKIHLVPFGEYMPFDEFFISLGVVGLGSLGGGLVPGDEPRLMRPAGAPPFAPMICYEMIFPGETMTAATGADWMVLVTNDGWFGGFAGPVQHLDMARMRAIETGLPIVRAANSGYSAVIDPFGRPLGRAESRETGVADSKLPAAIATRYRQIGEFATTLMLLTMIPLSTAGRRRRN